MLTFDFFLYLACFIAVFLVSGRKKFGKYTVLMLLVPLFDYLLAAVQRVVSGANKSGKCVNYFANDDGFKWVNDLSQLATGIVCNIFMLRNMSIASMISCEWISEEEEREKRRRL